MTKDLFIIRSNVNNPKGLVIISHGICEHSGRFLELTKYLNAAGYSVIRYDLRGHGRSKGRKGYISSYKVFINDLHDIILENNPNKELKVFLFGHSMGGAISAIYQLYYDDVDGIITSGAPTGYVPSIKPLKYLGIWWSKGIFIKSKFGDSLSYNPTIAIEYQKDPLVLKSFSIGLAAEVMVKGVSYLRKHLKDIHLPALILQGEDDQIVDAKFAKEYYASLPIEDKKLILYPHTKHEILNDYVKETVQKDIVEWLDEHTK